MEGSNPFVNEVKTFLCLPAIVSCTNDSPDSRDSYGWCPLKMHQITRASPAVVRHIVRVLRVLYDAIVRAILARVKFRKNSIYKDVSNDV